LFWVVFFNKMVFKCCNSFISLCQAMWPIKLQELKPWFVLKSYFIWRTNIVCTLDVACLLHVTHLFHISFFSLGFYVPYLTAIISYVLSTNHPHASTYHIITKCFTYVHNNDLHSLLLPMMIFTHLCYI